MQDVAGAQRKEQPLSGEWRRGMAFYRTSHLKPSAEGGIGLGQENVFGENGQHGCHRQVRGKVRSRGGTF